MLRPIAALAVLAIVVLASAAVETGDAAQAAGSCSEQSAVPSLELVYELKAGEETVTQRTRAQAEAIVCARLRTFGVAGGTVGALGTSRIRVLLPAPPGSDAQHLAAQLGTTAQLGFYDWEPSLIGPELTIGGWPGRRPKASALKRAEDEWRVAGRAIERRSNRRLILAGAFPSVYGAVELASRQRARSSCFSCSASKSRFYTFDRSAAHELIAGPAVRRADLRGAGGSRNGIVLKVPVGTRVAFEQPTDGLGGVLTTAEPGWYALKDRPALTASDILDPKQELDAFGVPNVIFGFTSKGRVAFQELTRRVALRGSTAASGPVSASEVAALSHHIAILYDNEIMVRPIIDFANNPLGIDGRTGAQISGGFDSIREARELAAILQTGSLPVDLTLVRQRSLPAQNS